MWVVDVALSSKLFSDKIKLPAGHDFFKARISSKPEFLQNQKDQEFEHDLLFLA